MSNTAKRFLVNGVEVLAIPQGGGLWAAMPVDIPGTIMKIMTGKLNINDFMNPANLRIEPLESLDDEVNEEEENESGEGCDCRDCQCQSSPASRKSLRTLREYRKAEGMSKTEMAEYLGTSRRTLGRWEDAGKLASEVGL